MMKKLITSCQDNVYEDSDSTKEVINLSYEELLSIANDSSIALTEDEALAMAEDFSHSLSNSTRSACCTKSIVSGRFKIGGIQNCSTRSEVEDSALVNKIDIITDTVKGYALVSADSRSAGVYNTNFWEITEIHKK